MLLSQVGNRIVPAGTIEDAFLMDVAPSGNLLACIRGDDTVAIFSTDRRSATPLQTLDVNALAQADLMYLPGTWIDDARMAFATEETVYLIDVVRGALVGEVHVSDLPCDVAQREIVGLKGNVIVLRKGAAVAVFDNAWA
jgi:hypothetical protein